VLDSLSPGEHAVLAELTGRVSAERKVTLSAGERSSLVLALAPETAAQALLPVVAPAIPTNSRPRGKLTLDTTPWTHVTLDGRKLGDTPLIEVSLPVGRQLLRLSNDEKNISTMVEVEIRAGRTTVKKLKL
jgi:eukaryotic-like serine/threonine-protein kinase